MYLLSCAITTCDTSFISDQKLSSIFSAQLRKAADPLLREIPGINKGLSRIFKDLAFLIATPEFKGIYYLASDVKEIKAAFQSFFSSPSKMEAFKAQRKQVVAAYEDFAGQASPLEDWFQKSRQKRLDISKDKRTQRRQEYVNCVSH
jgi:hypothetical protein